MNLRENRMWHTVTVLHIIITTDAVSPSGKLEADSCLCACVFLREMFSVYSTSKGNSNPVHVRTGPESFRGFSFSEFLDSRHIQVARLSALGTGRLYTHTHTPQTQSQYSFLLGTESTPRPYCGRNEKSQSVRKRSSAGRQPTRLSLTNPLYVNVVKERCLQQSVWLPWAACELRHIIWHSLNDIYGGKRDFDICFKEGSPFTNGWLIFLKGQYKTLTL